ncbi:hypothetical protein LIER_31147 [Lithospermum erythrorhizon]|uniref:PB1 domain-containing protein n=1 Tax=Lithospermum erythrorhizon TaxID=34254 RepID=A0AAV3RVD1_LITER
MVVPSINTNTFTNKPSSSSTIKFLCSYGGKILPRYQDGKLRYHGGATRVFSVERSISFHELLMKLGEICGESVSLLRCQLPTEDLDALISITSDEDLANIIEEYDRVAPSSSIKIRAFISVPKRLSPTSSFSTTTIPASSSSSSTSNISTSPPTSMHPSSSTNNLMSSKSVSLRNQRLSFCHMSPSRPGMLPLYYGRAPGYYIQRKICSRN